MTVDTRVFDDGVLSGIRRWFHYDDTDHTVRIETEIDARELTTQAKAEFNDFDKGPRPFAGQLDQPMIKVASLPLSIFMAWQQEGVFRDKKSLAKKLNDPDNRFFRTHPGTI